MTSRYKADDPVLGQIDLDDYFITDAWLIDQFVGNQMWALGGQNSTYGSLGLNGLADQSSPTQIGTLNSWKDLDASSLLSFAIKTDGTIWGWGINGTTGSLGLRDLIHRSSPTQIGSLTNWKQVTCGERNGIAIKTDGTLWGWGYNLAGWLGLGDITNRSSPVQIGSLTNWKQASTKGVAGNGTTTAVKMDGTLWAWGTNSSGQLGLGDSTPRSSPVQIGSLTNWKQVSTDFSSSAVAAIKTDGTLWAWGTNSSGQLGLGDSTPRSSPVQIGSLTNWKQISRADGSMAAIKTDGTLWTWGSNVYGQLGLNDRTTRFSPTQVGTLRNWKQVRCGRYTISAIRTDGTLWIWGNNGTAQLGIGDFVHRSSPVQVGSLTNWKIAALGDSHSLAITFTDIT